MQPKNNNQYPWGVGDDSPSSGQQELGNANYPPAGISPGLPPVKQSFFRRNKKISLIVGIALGVLLLVTVLAVVSGGNSKSKLKSATTNVELAQYSKDVFSMQYAKSLKINNDDKTDDGWLVTFADDPEISNYGLDVRITTSEPIFIDGNDALANQLEDDTETRESVTSDVVIAGKTGSKTVAKFTGIDDKEYYVVYAEVQIGSKFVELSGIYPVTSADIHNSLDAMLGSIKLK